LTGLEKCGLAGACKFHNAKTTFLSELFKLGVAPGVPQDMGRHVDFATTKRHYLGEDIEARRRAATKLERHLARVGVPIDGAPRTRRPRAADKAQRAEVIPLKFVAKSPNQKPQPTPRRRRDLAITP